MARPSARVSTAIVAVALGIAALVGGAEAVRFERDRNAAADLEMWTSRSGVRSLALEALLRRPGAGATPAALDLRLDLLVRALSARPLAAQDWVALAAVRHALALPQTGVDEAFMLSAVTGPAEADAMAQRALLGMLLWEASAAATRERALTDLCGLAIYEPSRLKLALSTKPAAVRAEIRLGLVAHACTPRVIAAIGL